MSFFCLCTSAHKTSAKKTGVMQDGIPESHKNPARVCSLETNTQHKEEGEVSITHCQLTAPVMEKHTHRGQGPAEITFQEGTSSNNKGERNTIKVW